MLAVGLGLGLFLAGFVSGALFIGQEIDLRIHDRHEAVHVWLSQTYGAGRRGPLFYMAAVVELTLVHPFEGIRLVYRTLTGLVRRIIRGRGQTP
jgi:hypothetical protein